MRVIVRVATSTVAIAVMAVAGCSTQSRSPDSDTTSKITIDSTRGAPSGGAPTVEGDTAALRAHIAQLEADARALAKTTGCNTATECRTAPVGDRPCGGPRDYIAYCAATTDSVALFKKLDELKVSETAYNRATGAMGTCEMRMPPKTEVVGGSCRAANAP